MPDVPDKCGPQHENGKQQERTSSGFEKSHVNRFVNFAVSSVPQTLRDSKPKRAPSRISTERLFHKPGTCNKMYIADFVWDGSGEAVPHGDCRIDA